MDRSRREARIERRRAEQRRSQMTWLGIIVVVAIAVTGLLIYGNKVRPPQRTPGEEGYTQKNGTSLGDPAAAVTFIEFADFQCSYCLNTYVSEEANLIEEYVNTGKMIFVYRLVGFLDRASNESQRSAEAAYCAADQNMFWEYHDVVWANYSTAESGGYSDDRLISFAESLDMDVARFSQCLLNNEKTAEVEQAETDAAAYGITGTPSFVINGIALPPGAQDYATLQRVIEQALEAAGAN